MSKMNAALYQGNGKLAVKKLDIPKIDEEEVLVKVRAEGVCGSDLLMWTDQDDPAGVWTWSEEPNSLPPGHEVTGEIIEVGSKIDSKRIGDRVAVDMLGFGVNCSSCFFCRQGQPIQCMDKKPDSGGGYAQYVKRNSAGCFKLNDNMGWDEGALVEPLAVSVHGCRRGKLEGGETVLVLGAGTIGQTAVAAARAMGAGKVMVTARYSQQSKLAKNLGADVVLPDGGDDLIEAVADETDGRGADITLESVGGRSGTTLFQSIELTRKQGRIVILGGFWVPIQTDWMEPLMKEQSIIFSSCYSILEGRHDFEVAIDMMGSGRVDLKPMVTHRFPLSDVQEAVNIAYDKNSGSVKVQIHQD
ncbi:MAG: zinc-binding dehydrogenase [Chloroflexota bacterium]